MDARLLDAVRRGWKDPLSEADFDALARDLFIHQMRHNPVTRAWWSTAGLAPGDVAGWRDVPPLPISAYRSARVAAFPPLSALDRPRFLSSGTTSAARSRVYVENLELYAAAILPPFRRHALADRGRMRLLFLSPPPERAPHSSLVHMFGVLCEAFGVAGSRFLASGDEADVEALEEALTKAEASREPVFLLGPAFAFVHALDALRARRARFRTAAPSRLFQTGGFKSLSRVVAPEELLGGYREIFGIPRERVVNEYGMAELASQFYARADGRYAGPHWVRWQVLDPLTLEPAPEGEPGVLAIWDLANRSNCFALRTDDLAAAHGRTFELLGRLAGSEPRGCSLDSELAAALTGAREALAEPAAPVAGMREVLAEPAAPVAGASEAGADLARRP